MKYYLGYYDNKKYVPIKVDSVGTSILDVVNFTLKYPSVSALKQELWEKNLIPNIDVRLDYVIEKGQKNAKYYNKLKNTDKIYVVSSKVFFSFSDLKYQLSMDADDLELSIFLFAKYLKKYGFFNQMKEYITDLDNNIEKLKVILTELDNIDFSVATKENLIQIMEYLNGNISLNNYRIAGYLDALIDSVNKDDHDIVNLFIYLKKYITFNSIPTIGALNNWLRLIINNRMSANKDTLDTDDYLDTTHKVEMFFNNVVYDYDFSKQEYKTLNGKRKIKERDFFDLAASIEEYYSSLYQSYIDSIEDKKDSIVCYEDDEDREIYNEYEEEFLEEADFTRIGTTSKEAGVRLRKNT